MNIKTFSKISMGLMLITGLSVAIGLQTAQAGIIQSGFDSNTLARNDDGSTGSVNIGFTTNFFGTDYTQLFVNNNGNVTYDAPLSTFTPFPLLSTSRVIIAPFFGDVDTRSAGNPVTYGAGTFNTRTAFGVNWVDVDYYSSSATHTNRNSFQLILVDRSDLTAGDFDIVFNYDQIQWETGQASGSDANGLGGNSARVGYSNGLTTAFELPGSALNGAFLDGGSNALISNSLNSEFDGQYIFNVRNGEVVPPIPEPATLALFGIGLAGLGFARKKKKSA